MKTLLLVCFVSCVTALTGFPAVQEPLFTNVTAAANLTWSATDANLWLDQTLNVTWVDYNGDGWLDLSVNPHSNPKPVLYRNLGNGTFAAPLKMPAGNDSHETMWADYDNDGDQDFFVQNGGQSGSGNPTVRHFWRHDAGDVFVDIGVSSGLSPRTGSGRGCLWFDWDKDGLLDLCLFNSDIATMGNYSELMHQTPSGFVKVNDEAGFSTPGFAYFGAVSDIFGDGKPDLVVFSGQKNDIGFVARVYENATTNLVDRRAELPTALSDTNSALSINGRDGVIADFNNDLIPDFLIVSTYNTSGTATSTNNLAKWIVDSQVPPLYVESGPGGYTNRSTAAGFTAKYWGMSAGAGDFDNDGDLDVYMTGEVGKFAVPARYYENNGGGTFTEIADANGAAYSILGNLDVYDQVAGMGFTVGDYNNDGFLDIYLAKQSNTNKTDISVPACLFRNKGNTNHWLEINLAGSDCNRDAIGARVVLTAGGKSQLREQTGMMRRIAQDMKRLHFGLGSATTVSSLTVYWPSGQTTAMTNVNANQILTITEPKSPGGYSQWAVAKGLTGTNYPLQASPAGDGIPNAVKYALQINPYTQGLDGLVVNSWAGLSGNPPAGDEAQYFSLRATLPKPLPLGVSCQVYASGTLDRWDDEAVEASRSDHFNGTETVVWIDVIARQSAMQRFMTLKTAIEY